SRRRPSTNPPIKSRDKHIDARTIKCNTPNRIPFFTLRITNYPDLLATLPIPTSHLPSMSSNRNCRAVGRQSCRKYGVSRRTGSLGRIRSRDIPFPKDTRIVAPHKQVRGWNEDSRTNCRPRFTYTLHLVPVRRTPHTDSSFRRTRGNE